MLQPGISDLKILRNIVPDLTFYLYKTHAELETQTKQKQN